MVAGMIFVGMLAGVQYEGWDAVTAFYFIVQITTTIGYGDLPVSDGMKGFLTVYVIGTLIVIAYSYQFFGQRLIAHNVERIRAKLRETEARLSGASAELVQRRFGQVNQVVGAATLFAGVIFAGAAFYRLAEHCTCADGASRPAGCEEPDFATCVRTGGYKATWASSLYMSVITLTTVGFGDCVPRTRAGRAFACAWMPLGVAATANFLHMVGEAFFHLEAQQRLSTQLDLQTFERLDAEKQGFLTREQYRSFVLVRHGLVPQEFLDEIDREFDALDADGSGAVTLHRITRGTGPESRRVSPFRRLSLPAMLRSRSFLYR